MRSSVTVRPRSLVFFFLVQNFAGAFEPGDGFGDLRADRDDLEHRAQSGSPGRALNANHSPRVMLAGQDFVSAKFEHQSADDAHQRRARKDSSAK